MIEELKKKMEKAKRELAIAENDYQKYEKIAKEEYGIESVDQAENRLDEIEVALKKNEDEKQKLLIQIKKELEKYGDF